MARGWPRRLLEDLREAPRHAAPGGVDLKEGNYGGTREGLWEGGAGRLRDVDKDTR